MISCFTSFVLKFLFNWQPHLIKVFSKHFNNSSTNSDLDYAHDFEWVKPFLFFINEEGGFKSCVVSLTPHYLVTFRHGTHLSYAQFSTVVRVVSIASEKQYDTVVVDICEEQDYVILKSNEEVVNRECPLQQCDVMKQFVVCGFAKGLPELTFIHGTVHSTHPFVYENHDKKFGPFIYGTAKTSPGDSGKITLYLFEITMNLQVLRVLAKVD